MNNAASIFFITAFVLSSLVIGNLALPFLCKVFLNYPEKENAVVYKGRLIAEGKESCGRKLKICTPPKYYVIDKLGKHEIYFGLPGNRERMWLNDENDQDIVEGTFWFDTIFGVIDQDVVYHTKKTHMQDHDGKHLYSLYQKNKQDYEYYFNYRKHGSNAFIFIVYLFLVYCFYLDKLILMIKNLLLTKNSTSK